MIIRLLIFVEINSVWNQRGPSLKKHLQVDRRTKTLKLTECLHQWTHRRSVEYRLTYFDLEFWNNLPCFQFLDFTLKLGGNSHKLLTSYSYIQKKIMQTESGKKRKYELNFVVMCSSQVLLNRERMWKFSLGRASDGKMRPSEAPIHPSDKLATLITYKSSNKIDAVRKQVNMRYWPSVRSIWLDTCVERKIFGVKMPFKRSIFNS